MKTRSPFLLLVLALWCATPSEGLAQVTAETMILEFDSNARPVRNFVVRNSSDEAVAVRAIPYFVSNPGRPDEKPVPTEDFLVSPGEFSIGPNGERTVRLLVRKPLVKEQQAFRVNFVPIAKEDREGEQEKKKIGMQLKVMTGVGILVFVNPPEKKEDLRWERQDNGSKIVFKNAGNINVMIDEPAACSSKDLQTCVPLQPNSKRMYPQNVLEFSGVQGKILHFVKRIGDDQEEQIFVE